MLQSIDTLIAFVVIMTVASLFVTILVQLSSAALSLRGKNLANALAVTFQTLAPSLEGKAHRLAATILSDPLLSDSTRTPKNKVREMVSTIADRLVPWNFRNIREAARLATAVRPDEVFAALGRLAKEGDGDAQKILKALMIPEDEAKKIRNQLGAFLALASEIEDPALKQKLLETLEGTPANLLVRANAAELKFETWFDSAQDRAQQWFRLHARGLTIAASFLIAFIFQLDAVEIFHHVSISSAARSALVAATQTVVQRADDVIGRDSAAASLREKRAVIEQLNREVNESGFDFIPVGFWRWPTEVPASPEHAERWYFFWSCWRHSAGMLLFAALLTLGAPYWYNLLKNLTSLRPALAQAISQEEAEQNQPKKP